MKSRLLPLLALIFSACGSASSPSDPDADVVDCSPACGSNASCEASTCTCDDGFEGDGQNCEAVADCADNNGGCDANADCAGAPGNVSCTCVAGFTGDGLSCADVDECLVDNGGCDALADCSNELGGRTCACQAGAVGDGLVCSEIWSLVGSLSGLDLSPGGREAVVVGTTSAIYFGPTTDVDSERFFRSFQVGSETFAGPHALPDISESDFCACGLKEVVLSDGTDVFLMGNDGLRYSPGSNAWSALANYQPAKRGEAAGTYDAISDLFLMIGGRGKTLSAANLVYQNSTDTFGVEPGTLPIAMDDAAAHTMPGTNLTYVAGGKDNGGLGLLSHVAGSATWTQLANAPADLKIPLGMGEFDGLMWVSRPDGSFAFYDPSSDTWTAHQIAAPAGFLGTATVNAESYVIAQVDNTSDVMIYRLNAIE